MTSRPGPTGLTRWPLLLLVVALVALPGLVIGPAPADAARAPFVAIDSVTPKAPTAKSKLRFTGALHNPSNSVLSDLTVRLRILQTPLTSRGLLQDVGASGTETMGSPIYTRTDEIDKVARGGVGGYDLKVPAADLGLTSFGVYAVAVEVVQADGTSVALQRTFLVYSPDKKSVPSPTKIGWVLPVVDRPHQEIGNTFSDDTLASSFAGGGRINRLVATGQTANAEDVPVTWAVDPAVLDAASTMTKGYRVRSAESKDKLVEGAGGEQAGEFLSDIQVATEGRSVLALPYADVDTVALARAGLSSDVTSALSQGKEVTTDILGTTPSEDLAWPTSGKVDQRGLDALAATGTRTAILDDDALPLTEQLSYTPDPLGTVRTSSGNVKALLADSQLTDIVGSARNRPGSAALTEQRFLAETALITAELPSVSRGLVVAPSRDWNPRGELGSDLVKATGSVPWLEPTSLDDLSAGKPADDQARGGLTYGKNWKRQELGRSHLKKVRTLHRSLDVFSSLFNPLPSEFEDYNLAVLRAESSAWRSNRHRGRELLDSVAARVAHQRGQVRILKNDRQLSLASAESSVPLTIENNLDHPVTVRLSIRSANERRMKVGKLPKSTTIGPRQKTTVKVPMNAASSGVIELRTQLLTPDREPYDTPVTFNVRATVYGSVALIITGSALVVLFAGSGYRVVRRVMRARRQRGEAAG
ncbi:MAG: hypothetical protein GEV07_17110 [Streptosporangiales bacterium]|nr:hypothetical protein [Streptosporangiales bacterium]